MRQRGTVRVTVIRNRPSCGTLGDCLSLLSLPVSGRESTKHRLQHKQEKIRKNGKDVAHHEMCCYLLP